MRSKSSKGGVEASVSNVGADPVCEFYTSHPYPPPVENLDRAREMYRDENVHRAEFISCDFVDRLFSHEAVRSQSTSTKRHEM